MRTIPPPASGLRRILPLLLAFLPAFGSARVRTVPHLPAATHAAPVIVASPDPAAPGRLQASLTYRPPSDAATTVAAATRAVAEQAAAKKAPPLVHDQPGVTDAQVLADIRRQGGALRITPASRDSTRDPFFRAEYETRDYYREVERAEAFARGRP